MPFGQLSATVATLRFRVALWNAGAVLLTGITILVGLREAVRHTLIHELDQVLLHDLNEITDGVESLRIEQLSQIHDQLNRKAREHKQHRWFVRFLDLDGHSIWSSNTAPEKPRPLDEVSVREPLSVGEYRLIQNFVILPDGTEIAVRVGSLVDAVNEDMGRIDRLVMLAGAVVLIVSPLCGYWLAGRAIDPLTEIIRQTDDLRPATLQRRLPVHHTGDELDQLSITINGLVDRIGRYLAEKRDFLANAAHELRTPLAAIRSTVEVSLAEERTPAEYQEILADLLVECEFLESLVNQLLLLAASDADHLQATYEQVDLHEIVNRAIEMFHAVADHQGVQLVVERSEPLVVDGNRHHLRQVINNLLDNALKFTPAGGRVSIRLLRSDDAERAVLRVGDTGTGIPPEDLPRIFERFYRADKSRQREGARRGTGLGLSICSAVIAAHQGTIRASSELGRGTTITIELPLAASTAT